MFKAKKINLKLILAGTVILTLSLALIPRYEERLFADYGITGGGNFSLTFNNQVCVGQEPVYTITAPSNLGSQTIYWTSQYNGTITSQPTFMLGSGGTWSEPGSIWQSTDVGSWTKTAMIDGASQSISFTVQSCGNTGYSPTIGGNVGNGYSPTIGGSVGNGYSPTIGGSVGGPYSPTIGEQFNNTPLPSSYVDANGYICRPQ